MIINAVSLSNEDVQDALDSASAGDTVQLPAGSATWDGPVTLTAPPNLTILGAGSLSTTGGGDQTNITDGYNGSGGILSITAHATGTLRIAGITWIGDVDYSTMALKSNGLIGVSGGKTRIDHCTWAVSQGNIRPLYVGFYGVMDHCIFNGMQGPFYGDGSGTGDAGHYVWTQPTDFGTDRFFYVEDNIFIGLVSGPGSSGDGNTACRIVYRFNTIQGSSGPDTHSTGHAFDDRGARAGEVYGNLFTVLPDQFNAPYAAAHASGGTWMLWGNTSEENNLKGGFIFSIVRKDTTTYSTDTPLVSYGKVGPAPIATGTVNVSGTAVTWVSGDAFNLSWPVGTVIYLTGATCTAIPGQVPPPGPYGGIASVNSTTSITLTNGGHSGGDLTGVAYYAGSAWDGNTDNLGYPALDQPGRGSGDLLVGTFPTMTNSETGTIAWPNQALEPIYGWANNIIPHPGYSGGSTEIYNLGEGGGRIVFDRDVYKQASGIQTTSSSPFNGTSGTGWGTLANRPTTCTAGVAYWAIDQGSWNTSESNPYGVDQEGASGVLYVATATDTWTEYYVPYTYPHPLQGSSTSGRGVSGLVKLSGNCTLK